MSRQTPAGYGWEPAGDAGTHAAIEQHIERHFGPISYVWHELASGLVHIDVFIIEPRPDRPYYTLITCGMSDLPMTVPADDDSSPYAELMICLPPDWPMTSESMRDESVYWPIRLLKTVARLPHEYDTWIGAWHSIPNGDPAQPYAPDSQFMAVLVTPPLRCRPQARVIALDHSRSISLLALLPLHLAELDLKLSTGATALLDALDRASVSELLDPARPSSV